ncbi:SMC-Scp complex subunit ScpB [Bifidobacterium leontopitheci]|uniref:Segregation and condensation protein ScpB n=1 Tax=Bifidobacterium leontopitheci TaxID=2650774 RepID=A0A6I1GKQ3_9BIFI|nr:SMC-Scp complex subunit ScpB [Bifidobacterium leontopitheci]KAB7791362.1 segregation and condensation protein ScpB [Bifidobacterium leontopitheci]
MSVGDSGVLDDDVPNSDVVGCGVTDSDVVDGPASDGAAASLPGGLESCLEAILMVADQPQQAADLARVLSVGQNEVERALRRLADDYDAQRRGFELRHTARGWQYASRARFERIVAAFVTDGQVARLSQAALEALAIIAYRQPVTRAQVAAVRGVNSDGVIRSLTVRGLVREQGVDADSHAALLVTSGLFLEKMGLDSLEQLPSLAPFLPDSAAAVEGDAA